ncbi:hypothetical protein N6L27_07985 [Leisingera sp. SS27]|uniref:hypothetical protein n=1 Tax=Leisingera sp. SS27 TaxID=2979462 RepID=UPI00232B091B|nr:hypothetical protein [Leisingera sp. SS27]MDC0657928.1 hypothetical protein [Leisingera sp. SS27]
MNEKLDNGELILADVIKECNVSQSLVYKWRADVKASRIRKTTETEDAFFSEIAIQNDGPMETCVNSVASVTLRGREIEISLPSTYPVDDLIKVILSLEARA